MKSALKKRIKITKNKKIKTRQAARSHLRRNKSKRSKLLQDLASVHKRIKKLISKR